MKKLILLALALMLVLPLSIVSLSAQDSASTHPLQDILRRIPSTEITRENMLSYINIQATYQSLDWVDSENDYTYESFTEAHPNGFRFANRWGFQTNELARLPFGFNPAGDVSALDIFNIEQIVTYGMIPDSGTLLRGDFDVESLLSAYGAMAFYAVESVDNYHFIRNQGELEPQQFANNFFDPILKRGLPLVIHANDESSLIASASSDSFYEYVGASFQYGDNSLWNEPYYQLTAQALIDWETSTGATIVQALWIPQAELLQRSVNFRNQDDLSALPYGLQPIGGDNQIPDWAVGYRDIVDYELPVLIADLQIDSQQVVLLVVPFDYIGNAEYSALALTERIETYNNQARVISDISFVELYNGTISHTIQQDIDNRGVAVIAVRYDAPAPNNDEDQVYQAEFFNIIYQSILEATFYPLWEVTLP